MNDVERYVAGNKLKLMVALQGHAHYSPVGQVTLFEVDGVTCAHQNLLDDDYPSELVMASIALAVGATLGTEGIPGPDYALTDEQKENVARRNAYRDRYLGQWRDKYDQPVTATVKGNKP